MNPKRSFYNWLAYLALMIFILYWTSIFILAMPRNSTKMAIIHHVPRFKNMLGYSWKLFTPPANFNLRLYIVVRDSAHLDHPDSTEILLSIAKEKQAKAPFNNRENVIDYLVYTNVNSFIFVMWHDKTIPGNSTAIDSAIRKNVTGGIPNHPLLKTYLASINNYCNLMIKEKHLYQKGSEARFVITEKFIQPFSEFGNTSYNRKELLVFETDFSPILR